MNAGKHPPMTADPIAVACDHGGLDLKALVCAELEKRGIPVLDLGTDTTDSVDYPDFALRLADALKQGAASRGVLICGTGIGISIAANRHTHIRAALVHDSFGARMARQHNDANVLVLGGRTMGPEVAKDVLDIFLTTPFEGGRHERRVRKLAEFGER
jgi:ribose 5-phosphate isomerase B